jgi:predicted permease
MLLHNFRYGLRQLRKQPGFFLVAITTLALGIGLTGAMFTVVYAVLLRPLPFADPERVVIIGQANRADNQPGPASLPNIRDWREQSQSFEEIAYWNLSVHSLNSRQQSEFVADIRCSANLFSLLRVQPVLGRPFDPEADRPGKGNVAVLSAKAWKGVFAADPNVIGTTFEIGTDQYTVIGVMPENFAFPLTLDRAMVWIPVQTKPEWEDRNTAMLQVVGRLRPGVRVEAAQAELTSLVPGGTNDNQGQRVLVEDYRKSVTGDLRTSLLFLEAAVLAVWLIACINIISLQMARAASRRRETAIRCALGAGRRQLVSQFFAESALLSGGAGIAGLALCFGFLGALRFYLESKLPFADAIRVDLPVVAAILVMSLASTLLVGVWPALQAQRTSPQEALRDGGAAVGGSRRQRRAQDALVVFEVALSLVLLLNAGLLLRTLNNLRATPLGFKPDRLVVAQLPLFKNPQANNDVAVSVYDPLLAALAHVPGVESAAISTVLPMDPNSTVKFPVQIFGKPAPPKPTPTAELRIVSPELYSTLGVGLISGRTFNEADTRASPWVVVVNRAFVRKYFADDEPLGQRVRTDDSGPHKFSTIVGVVEDTHQRSVADAVVPELDLCYKQLSPTDGVANLLGMVVQLAVRTSQPAAAVIPGVRAVLQPINPEVPANLSPMQEIVDRSIGNQTMAARLIGIFAACALLIALIGLYGLLTYNVTRMTRDIAVRLALGATRRQVVGLVIGHAGIVLAVGLLIGFAVWDQTSRLLRSYLYGMGTHDLFTLIAMAVVFLSFGLLASYLPARRASLIDPMTALRHE